MKAGEIQQANGLVGKFLAWKLSRTLELLISLDVQGKKIYLTLSSKVCEPAAELLYYN
jgi:hypothetical protein